MALSSSAATLRRLLRVSPSSPLMQWNLPFAANRRNCSSAPEDGSGGAASTAAASTAADDRSTSFASKLFGDIDEANAKLPPLTIPKLFVSGLSKLTTDENLRNAFGKFGQVTEAKVITDRISGRSKGFGFVGYGTLEEAETARREMNAKFLDGWVIFVDPAKPREYRPPPQPEPQTSETGFRTNKTVGWCG